MVPDAYLPALADLELSDDEISAIETALQHADPWAHDDAALAAVRTHLQSAKQKLIDHHMARHHETCCYCRTLMGGGGRFVRDREHILPKWRYRALSYRSSNLSAACKRCNMEYKAEKIDFVVDPDTVLDDHENPDRYLIVHPNFDRYENHIRRRSVQDGVNYIVSYMLKPGDTKAQYTFEFFGLAKLEKESFDEAQGLFWSSESEDNVEGEFPDRI